MGTISVTGNVHTDSALIVRSFGVRTGSNYVPDVIRRGIRRLFALGLFEDVWAERFERPGVTDILIHVVERPRISGVEFQGNDKRETSELERKITVRQGDMYSPTKVIASVDSLIKFYKEEGFARATVEAREDTSVGVGQVRVTFVINEGQRVRITKFTFPGASAFSEGQLRKRLESKKKGFFGGGEVHEEDFPRNKQKLEYYMRSEGYRDARVVSQELLPGDKPRDLTLEVRIEEGRPYYFGQARWEGNTVIGNFELLRSWKGRFGEPYDISKIDEAQGGAYADYAERGFLYLNIEPVETVQDSIVDVTFVVQEGRPSQVRYVNITGNKGTREKVIRREMAIHEGQRFRRSALVRTQGDIFRLGIFEDVQIDFQPADSTDVDINLRVKEKQVGTASAGAGYTSQSGLTGFIELSHNNVLGNQQTLSLHLERGGRREEYFLSFTEPWFRDTPTLLGFSVFNTLREYDVYEERRVGGSVRLGRPLPWPDYSRGSVTYRLERVKISSIASFTSVVDSITRSGFINEDPQLTSSMLLSFQRNTRNNPFYPTGGTDLSWNTELAGGIFGGSVNFHKHRIEGRVYFPSIVPSFTTMLRARIGLLGEYGDQNNTMVPVYEKFRLGGGTTTDPLRGYGDYMVVPRQYVNEVVTATDSLGNPIATAIVRYPGGRYASVYTLEQQFPIAHPLHGVLFLDAGNVWDLWSDISPLNLLVGAGAGFRLEIPLLGNIGFDYGYGFNRDELLDRPRWAGHFLLGNFGF